MSLLDGVNLTDEQWALVGDHLKYAFKMARASFGVDFADEVATDALIQATQRYDESTGISYRCFVKVFVMGALRYAALAKSKRPLSVPLEDRVPCLEREWSCTDLEEVRDLVKRLRPEERRVVQLLYQEGMTTRQAGDAMKVSRTVIYKLHRRLLDRLRRWYGEAPN